MQSASYRSTISTTYVSIVKEIIIYITMGDHDIKVKKPMKSYLTLFKVLERRFTLREVRRVMKPVGMKMIPINKNVAITCR